MATLINIFCAPELTHPIGNLILWLYEIVGNFGWTVVLFTIILKTVLLPLDIWQKKVMIANNNKMKKMKPQLEKLQKQYAGNRELYSQKQMELYKKEGYSLFGSCLPMLVTIGIFIIVFGGFNAMVRYQNEVVTYNLAERYNEGARGEELADAYDENMEGWLWIKNVFRPDTWSDIVPTYKQYSKNNAQMPDNFNELGDYNSLVGPAIERHNKETISFLGIEMTNIFDFRKWNGMLILPILATLLNFAVSFLMKNSQPEQPMQLGPDGQPMNNQASMKMMQYMMPAMIGIFSLFYSAAFAIYLFFSALYTGAFNLIFNMINSKAEKAAEEKSATSYRR